MQRCAAIESRLLPSPMQVPCRKPYARLLLVLRFSPCPRQPLVLRSRSPAPRRLQRERSATSVGHGRENLAESGLPGWVLLSRVCSSRQPLHPKLVWWHLCKACKKQRSPGLAQTSLELVLLLQGISLPTFTAPQGPLLCFQLRAHSRVKYRECYLLNCSCSGAGWTRHAVENRLSQCVISLLHGPQPQAEFLWIAALCTKRREGSVPTYGIGTRVDTCEIHKP